jgi:hypothetical protein
MSSLFQELQRQGLILPRCGSPFSRKEASNAEETRESLDTIAKALVNGEIDKQGLQSLAEEVG